ncbi:hypothetical protein C8J57DRAFT_1241544 [Mycena rebaudengoi]|nr:hypothetical protein C8J57DRAFT_1241544 [Mycena rebaudengoi]
MTWEIIKSEPPHLKRLDLNGRSLISAPRQTFNGGFWCDPDICGNFAAIVIFQNPGWGLFLIDRAEDVYILIGLTHRPQISLLSGHVVIATPGSAHSIQFIVLNMRSLCAQWRPLLTLNWDPSNWTTLANITPLLSEILVLDNEILLNNPIIRLSVYESPLQFGRYNIRVHAWNSPAPPRSPSSLCWTRRIRGSAEILLWSSCLVVSPIFCTLDMRWGFTGTFSPVLN